MEDARCLHQCSQFYHLFIPNAMNATFSHFVRETSPCYKTFCHWVLQSNSWLHHFFFCFDKKFRLWQTCLHWSTYTEGSYRLRWRCSNFLSHSRQPSHHARCQGRQLRALSPSLNTARVAHAPCRGQNNESFNRSWACNKGSRASTNYKAAAEAASLQQIFLTSETKDWQLRKKLRKQHSVRGRASWHLKKPEMMGAVRGDTSNAIGVPLLQVLQSHGHSMLLEGNCSLIRFTWAHCWLKPKLKGRCRCFPILFQISSTKENASPNVWEPLLVHWFDKIPTRMNKKNTITHSP